MLFGENVEEAFQLPFPRFCTCRLIARPTTVARMPCMDGYDGYLALGGHLHVTVQLWKWEKPCPRPVFSFWTF